MLHSMHKLFATILMQQSMEAAGLAVKRSKSARVPLQPICCVCVMFSKVGHSESNVAVVLLDWARA